MGFWDDLDEAKRILGTVKHGYDRIENSKRNFDDVITGWFNGGNQEILLEFEHKKEVCIRNTIIFCVIIIILTILICAFL